MTRSAALAGFTLAGSVVVWLAVMAAAHSEERPRPDQRRWSFDDAVRAESYRQGATDFTTFYQPGRTTTCRSYRQGWQMITTCN